MKRPFSERLTPLTAIEILQIQMDLADIGYWSIDLDTGLFNGSSVFWRLLGYEPGELENTLDNLKKIHNLDDWHKGWDLIADLLTGKIEVYENEIRYLKKDGSWLWCEVKGTIAQFHEDGSPFLFVGYIRAIDSQKELEKRLEKALASNSLNQGELDKAQKTIKELSEFLPICSSCKSIRNDEGYWKELETYVESHSSIVFSHGLCETCQDKLYGEEGWYKRYKAKILKTQK